MSIPEKGKRTLFFSTQGFKPQEIEIAPDLLQEVASKRAPLIQEEDTSLNANIKELDVGTRARNRAFQERLDEVWESTRVWDSQLKAEAKAAVETILDMKDQYQRHLANFSNSLQKEVNGIFDEMDNEILPRESKRVDVIEKDLDVFIKISVPENIERQTGKISRDLRRAYETFDIEKIKEMKRETKLVEKANRHLKNTAQRIEDEKALMSSAFFNVEDDVVEQETRSSKMQLLRNDAALKKIYDLNGVSYLERDTRTEEDMDVLDTVIETQKMLQKTVLLHFGTSKEDEEGDEEEGFPDLDKLNERMAKVNAHKEGRKKQEGDGDGEGGRDSDE